MLDELHRDAVAGYAFVDRIDTVKAYNDGWLRIATPTEAEIERTETILDVSLPFTDAECIAVAATRDTRLLTDDRHVGEIASQHAVTVWDLPLFLKACIHTGVISSEAELDAVLDDLVEQDFYRFAADDRAELYGFFEE